MNAETVSRSREEMDETLIPELAEYRRQFEAIKQDVQDLVAGLTDEQLNWHAQPGVWSIAECLSHLTVTGTLYLPQIESKINEARTRQLFNQGPFRHSFIGNWFVRSLEPPVKRKFRAPKKFVPTPDQPLAKVLPEFLSVQESFLHFLKEANGLHLARIKVASPVTSLLRLTLGQSFALTTAHERRHLWQAREVKNHPNFPK